MCRQTTLSDIQSALNSRDVEFIREFILTNKELPSCVWIGVNTTNQTQGINLLEVQLYKFLNDAANHHNSHILSIGSWETEYKKRKDLSYVKVTHIHSLLLSEHELDREWMIGDSPSSEYKKEYQRGLKNLTYGPGKGLLNHSGSVTFKRYSKDDFFVEYQLQERHKSCFHAISCPCKRKSACRNKRCDFQHLKSFSG